MKRRRLLPFHLINLLFAASTLGLMAASNTDGDPNFWGVTKVMSSIGIIAWMLFAIAAWWTTSTRPVSALWFLLSLLLWAIAWIFITTSWALTLAELISKNADRGYWVGGNVFLIIGWLIVLPVMLLVLLIFFSEKASKGKVALTAMTGRKKGHQMAAGGAAVATGAAIGAGYGSGYGANAYPATTTAHSTTSAAAGQVAPGPDMGYTIRPLGHTSM